MATVSLEWQESLTEDGEQYYHSNVKARNDEDALFMEVYDRGWTVLTEYTVTAYYWLADRERHIPLYEDDGFDSVDDAKTALAQWYVNYAPTLLMTLAA